MLAAFLGPFPDRAIEDSADAAPVEDASDKKLHFKQYGFKEDPYLFHEVGKDFGLLLRRIDCDIEPRLLCVIMQVDGDSYWPPVKEFYGFSDDFPARNLLTRSAGSVKRNIYLVSDMVREVIQNNDLCVTVRTCPMCCH